MASNKTNFVLMFTLLAIIISTLTLPLINARELSTATQSYDEVKYQTVGATDKGVVPDAVCYYLRGHRVCTPPASTSATP
ncbi:hypothetical protein DsansV1_C06g0063951 [Dioscorea sansibarensis]